MAAFSGPHLHAILTGPPGVGKTTLVKKVCAALGKQRGDVKMNGFYTEEVREGGRGGRVGFDVVTLEGERGVLARISGAFQGAPVGAVNVPRKAPTVGRYRVDIASFERTALPTILETERKNETSGSGAKSQHIPGRRLVVVDEIGKMELFSRSFVDAVQRLFESSREKEERVVLVTVPLARGGKSHRLLEQLRLRTDCRLFQVTERNRESLVEEISQFVLQRLAAT